MTYVYIFWQFIDVFIKKVIFIQIYIIIFYLNVQFFLICTQKGFVYYDYGNSGIVEFLCTKNNIDMRVSSKGIKKTQF